MSQSRNDAASPQTDLFAEFSRALAQVKMPGLDTTALAEGGRRDIEALVAANRSLYEGLQALSRKQSEIRQQTIENFQDAAVGAVAGIGANDPVKQAELARKAFSQAITDMRELAEIAQKSQKEAVAGITERAKQRADEIRSL